MRLLAVMTMAAGLSWGAANQTYTGVVTDTMCGADHSHMGNTASPAQCVKDCVKAGSKYALLVGSKVYTLSDQRSPEKYAGQKVKVTGTLNAKTQILKVDSIEPAK